jgi:hypothetical protein
MKTLKDFMAEAKHPSNDVMRKYNNMADFELRNEIKKLPADHPKRKEMEAVHTARQSWG